MNKDHSSLKTRDRFNRKASETCDGGIRGANVPALEGARSSTFRLSVVLLSLLVPIPVAGATAPSISLGGQSRNTTRAVLRDPIRSRDHIVPRSCHSGGHRKHAAPTGNESVFIELTIDLTRAEGIGPACALSPVVVDRCPGCVSRPFQGPCLRKIGCEPNEDE